MAEQFGQLRESREVVAAVTGTIDSSSDVEYLSVHVANGAGDTFQNETRLAGGRLYGPHLLFDPFGCCGSLAGQFLDLMGNDRETLASLTGPGASMVAFSANSLVCAATWLINVTTWRIRCDDSSSVAMVPAA